MKTDTITPILRTAFPGQRSPIPQAAEWFDVDQSTIYRWIKDPSSTPRYALLLLAYLDLLGPVPPYQQESDSS